MLVPAGMEITDIIDYAMLFTAVSSAIIWALWVLRHRRLSLYAVPPMSWCVNVILFFATISMQSPDLHIIWSSVISLHAAFLLLGISVVMIVEGFVIDR